MGIAINNQGMPRARGGLPAIETAAGLGVAGVSHLVVVPVMAIYGVSICPVLGELGFGFGCKYTGSFIAFVLAANCLLNIPLWRTLSRRTQREGWQTRIVAGFPLLSFLVHLAAFGLGTRWLLLYLRGIHVPEPSLDRLRVALFITTLLLGVLQATIVDWLASHWMREELKHQQTGAAAASGKGKNLSLGWIGARLWGMLPLLAFVAILGTLTYRKLNGLLDYDEVDATVIKGAWMEILRSAALLAGWFVLVRFFTLLKERTLIADVRQHLEALSHLDASYRSPLAASTYWEGIFRALNDASELLRQRSRLIKGLSAYVTTAIVDRVLGNKELKPEGQNRELCVLVSDLRDFTGLSSRLPAEKVVQLLNIYFEDMLGVLTAEGLILDKFIGDGILAYVDPDGLESAEKVCQRGVRAALAMQTRLEQTNLKLASLNLPTVELGVAVHHGAVVLGSIGAPARMQFTVIGDPVNVTARLEGLCKRLHCGVIVSDAVFEKVGPELRERFCELGGQKIRGLKTKITTYGVKRAARRPVAA